MEPPDQISTDQIFSAVSQLSLPEIERLFDRLLALQAERKASHLSEAESALMERINQSPASDARSRMMQLRAKRDDGSITDGEYEELTGLVDHSEELHADRVAALVDLAKLRGATLSDLMNQLGIQFPQNV
ncbi:MAG TPA: STAS/SEC14 domain-containing protein [Blastocatellia bacterium]|nr:STAS/SEC14 domain-containing protein [Blastocatellia bacterium]